MPRTHASCSPSKLKNREICPSYDGDQSAPPHPMTLSGTRCHDALETDDDSSLDDGELALVNYVRDYLSRLPVPETRHREIHLDTGIPDVDGYCDELRIHTGGRSADVVDFKFGWGFQGPAKTNAQGGAYVLGVFRNFPNIDTITLHFPYPRLHRVTTHTFTRAADAADLELRVVTVRHRWATEHGTTHVYDPDNCLYCKHRLACPAVRDRFVPVLPALPPLRPPGSTDDPGEVAAQLKAAKQLEHFAKRFAAEVRAHATGLRMEGGVPIPGYDLRETYGRTKVTHVPGALRLAEVFGAGDPARALTVSVTALERLVGEAAPRGKATANKREFRDALIADGHAEREADLRLVEVKDRGADLPRLTEQQQEE